MKNIVIAAVIAATLPMSALAAPIIPGEPGMQQAGSANPQNPAEYVQCVPWNQSMSMPFNQRSGTYNGQPVCQGGNGVLSDERSRLYNLEVAVQQLQAQVQALQSSQGSQTVAGATGGTDPRVTDLENRVSALEHVTKAIQDSLLYIVQLFTQALNKASGMG